MYVSPLPPSLKLCHSMFLLRLNRRAGRINRRALMQGASVARAVTGAGSTPDGSIMFNKTLHACLRTLKVANLNRKPSPTR